MSSPLMSTYTVKPMVVEDLESIMLIENAIYAFPWSRGNFIDSLSAGYLGWVLWEGGELAAYTVVMRSLDEVHLLNLSVAQPWQRQGLGRRLLAFLLEQGKADGLHRMLLEVRPSNLGALSLYRALGFQQIGLRKAYYPAPQQTREDAIVMERLL